MDYIPTSKFPYELHISAPSDHQIKGEALEHLRHIISDTIIPSWTRVPHKMGSPSDGRLKATECALLYKVSIPFLILSKQMSLDERNFPNTQRKVGKSEDLENGITKSECHFISATNISTI
ncbi:hypothetical protein O181_008817 [Austropuccinia psidii MF-1]|uniref:Uncharacterized protein n=1 Tax=Austropuccinia psidii MF-1 TaxID=1389203 RepID=A0A9Q3BPJ3_9BASI|nr:hypothetical protein [Austropuccinia psidii MF-1]